MKILFVADVFGRPGRYALSAGLERWREAARPDLVIVNGENAAGGFGLTPEIAQSFFDEGVDVLTTGNHVWDKREIYPLLDSDRRVLRPDNVPDGNPGSGLWIGSVGAWTAVVINLQGRVFMRPFECPFRRLDRMLADERVRAADVVFVDFHAEATAEKLAFGRYADGRVAAVVGTHTHVPTADARVLPGGTAYRTDAGMTGPHGGVIGVRADEAIERFKKQTPNRFQVATDDVRFQGVLVVVDPRTGRAESIEAIDEPID